MSLLLLFNGKTPVVSYTLPAASLISIGKQNKTVGTNLPIADLLPSSNQAKTIDTNIDSSIGFSTALLKNISTMLVNGSLKIVGSINKQLRTSLFGQLIYNTTFNYIHFVFIVFNAVLGVSSSTIKTLYKTFRGILIISSSKSRIVFAQLSGILISSTSRLTNLISKTFSSSYQYISTLNYNRVILMILNASFNLVGNISNNIFTGLVGLFNITTSSTKAIYSNLQSGIKLYTNFAKQIQPTLNGIISYISNLRSGGIITVILTGVLNMSSSSSKIIGKVFASVLTASSTIGKFIFKIIQGTFKNIGGFVVRYIPKIIPKNLSMQVSSQTLTMGGTTEITSQAEPTNTVNIEIDIPQIPHPTIGNDF